MYDPRPQTFRGETNDKSREVARIVCHEYGTMLYFWPILHIDRTERLIVSRQPISNQLMAKRIVYFQDHVNTLYVRNMNCAKYP